MYPIFRSSTLEKTSRFIYMLGGESVNQFADFNNFSLNFGATDCLVLLLVLQGHCLAINIYIPVIY